MIRLSCKQLKEAEAALKKLLNSDLDISVSLSLRRFVGSFITELQYFEAERLKTLRRFAKKDERGGIESLKGEALFEDESRRAAFQQEFDKLLAETISLDVEPLDLSGIQGIRFTPLEVHQLSPLLCEPQARAKSESNVH